MDSVGNIILYFVVAIAMVISAYLAVTTTKILRAATYLLFSLICTAISISSLDINFSVPCRLLYMPEVLWFCLCLQLFLPISQMKKAPRLRHTVNLRVSLPL